MDNIRKLPRLTLPLGKFRVTRVERTAFGVKFLLLLPGLGGLVCDVPIHADVREGDILTLFTEVLRDAPPH